MKVKTLKKIPLFIIIILAAIWAGYGITGVLGCLSYNGDKYCMVIGDEY